VSSGVNHEWGSAESMSVLCCCTGTHLWVGSRPSHPVIDL
jgi:hypothetical protein